MVLLSHLSKLRKGLTTVYNTNQILLPKHNTHECDTRNTSTNRTIEPTTYVTQEMIEAANQEDSAPKVPAPNSCCGEGCQNCVWLEYLYKVKFYYKHDNERIKAALSQIPCSDIRAFVEFELRKKLQKENI